MKPATTKKVSLHSIPAGGSLAQATEDSRGNVTTKIIQGNQRPSGRDPIALKEWELARIQDRVDKGELTEKEAKILRNSVTADVKPGKYSGGFGGGGGSAGGPGLKELELARKKRKDDVDSYRADVEAENKIADNARAKLTEARVALTAHNAKKPPEFSLGSKPTGKRAAAWQEERDLYDKEVAAWQETHKLLDTEFKRYKTRSDEADLAHEAAMRKKAEADKKYRDADAAEEEAKKGPTLGDAKGGKTAAPAEVPAVGTVKRGYRFKGGNPASQANWEKV